MFFTILIGFFLISIIGNALAYVKSGSPYNLIAVVAGAFLVLVIYVFLGGVYYVD